MQNYCETVKRVGDEFFTEPVGWAFVLTTIITLVVVATISLGFGTPMAVGITQLAVMVFAGALGFAVYQIRRDDSPIGMFYPAKSLEWLGFIGSMMAVVSLMVGFFHYVIG